MTDSGQPRSPLTDGLSRLLSSEWGRLGAAGLVALVLGLIGMVIASSVEPIEAPPIVASPTTTSTLGATTTTFAVATTTAPGSTATTPAGSATIEVSVDAIDFGDDQTQLTVQLSNSGSAAGAWSVSSSSEAVELSPAQGELDPTASEEVTLTLNREGISEGDLSETVTFTLPNGEAVVAVSGSHEDNPVIHNPQASPPTISVSGCGTSTTTVSARVRDTSELERVLVRWSPDGSSTNETTLSLAGNDIYEGTVGPFTTPQTASLRVVAFDVRGNAGGARVSVTINPCS